LCTVVIIPFKVIFLTGIFIDSIFEFQTKSL
jgi:hypothetical protein